MRLKERVRQLEMKIDSCTSNTSGGFGRAELLLQAALKKASGRDSRRKAGRKYFDLAMRMAGTLSRIVAGRGDHRDAARYAEMENVFSQALKDLE